MPGKPLRPNIFLIMADDMGFSDLGCYGGEIQTTHLDALASRGMRFRSFYNNAVCMPTRGSLLTGLYPHQVGAAAEGRLLAEGNATLAEVLREAGYRTLMSGKWHNGSSPSELPVSRGFERYRGLLSGSSNYLNPGLPRAGEPAPAHKRPGETRPWGFDGEVVHPFTPQDPDFYTTHAFTDWALEFLDETEGDDRPFFLYLAYTAPHFPMQAPEADIATYRGRYLRGWDRLREARHARQVENGIVDPAWGLSERDPLSPAWEDCTDKDRWDMRMAVYAAMVSAMDRGVGRVLERVRELGEENNTLVLFLSDNGGCGEHIDRTPGVSPGPVNSYCSVGAPWANASNTPFRRFKAFHYEGGISTPLIACWPGTIHPGSVSDHVGHVMDVMPTLLDLAGAEYPSSALPLEGVSLVPALTGGPAVQRSPLFWEFRGCRAAREGRWKIVNEGPPRSHVTIPIPEGRERWELYDMERDRCETRNLADIHPEIVRELDAKWQARWNRVRDAAQDV